MKTARISGIRSTLGKLTTVALLTAAAPANAESRADKAGLDLAIFLATKTPPHRCFVPIVKPIDELSYWVPVIINRAGTNLFAIDTGFTGSLAIPRGFLDSLRNEGDLTKLDRSGPPPQAPSPMARK